VRGTRCCEEREGGLRSRLTMADVNLLRVRSSETWGGWWRFVGVGRAQPSSAGALAGWGGGYGFPAYPEPGDLLPVEDPSSAGKRGKHLRGVMPRWAPRWAVAVSKRPGFTADCLRGGKGPRGCFDAGK